MNNYETVTLRPLTGNVKQESLNDEFKGEQFQQRTLITQQNNKFKIAPYNICDNKVVHIAKSDRYQGIRIWGTANCVGIFMLQDNKMSACHLGGGIDAKNVEGIKKEMLSIFDEQGKSERYIWIALGATYRASEHTLGRYESISKEKTRKLKTAVSEILGVESNHIFISCGDLDNAMTFEGKFGCIFANNPEQLRTEACTIDKSEFDRKDELERLCQQIIYNNPNHGTLKDKLTQLQDAIRNTSRPKIKLKAYENTSLFLVAISEKETTEEARRVLMADYLRQMDDLKPSLYKIMVGFCMLIIPGIIWLIQRQKVRNITAAIKNVGLFSSHAEPSKVANNMNLEDKQGLTPFRRACDQGQLDVVESLLRNPDIKLMARGGTEGKEALSLAIKKGHIE